MINNEKQYKISKKRLNEIVTEIETVKNASDQHPLRNKLILASLLNVKQELEEEITDYESLKNTSKNTLPERVISELPSILTEYKIISGMTQKEFSEKLGLKEQQLQRYEADNFKGVSFKNLLKFLEAIGLEIRIKETRLNKSRQRTPAKKKQSSR
ncbi:helix-turn-helix transcriptional regulator [Pseudoflavitalea sp. X16]|uniref:helix-turn-helix domain-containing protein n=1 Tax=Paraflavitalea devenefica TaxID=2716334 RepID=UPI00141EF76C|nr:helix-turn-helix transcriptional regulator [Paraflavitalea devenefica]NII24807.1 helix-turn-helix transcriptional regulator [Paraflavitalea devenefica]